MPLVKRQQARYRAYRLGWQAPLSKGKPFAHTIASAYVVGRYEYRLHATKGFRYRKLAPNRNELLEYLMERTTSLAGRIAE